MFRHVWQWFNELTETLEFDGSTGLHQPLVNREILAWAELNQQPIAAHELRLIRKMARIFAREERAAKLAKSKEETAKAESTSKRRRLWST